jgi:hypothetical protein
MKFPFSKKNKKVQFSDDTLKVTRVRVITKSAPNGKLKKNPTRGVSSVSVSSSPTGVKDQALIDFEESFVNSEPQKSQQWGADYSSFYSCGTSSCGSTECSYDNDGNSTTSKEVKKRWNDMKKIMTMKIEEIHDSVDIQFQKIITGEGDFGRSAMIAVEKNRNDMDEMMIRIDEEAKNMDIATEIAVAVDSTTTATTAAAADGTTTSYCPAGCPIQVPFNYFQKYSNSTSSTNSNSKEGPHDENSTTNKIDSSSSSPLGSRIAACTGGVGNNALVCDSVYQSTMTTCTDLDLGGCTSTTSPCDDNSSNDVIIKVQIPNDTLR